MLQTTGLWLLPLAASIVAAEIGLRSLDLSTTIKSLEGELGNCSYQCFTSTAGSRGCDDVYQLITSDARDCLEANCATHEALEADRLLVEACGAAPRNVQAQLRGITWALFALTTIFLAGRLSRASYFGGAQLGLDDWAIVASYVIIIAVTVGMELMIDFGLGTDIWTLEDNHIIVVVILFYVAEFAYIVEITATKISILLLYIRIFPDQRLRMQIYSIMIILALYLVAFIVGVFNYCKPFSYTWYRWDNQESGKCDDINVQTFVHAGLNILLDLVIFFIPIPQLMKLDLSLKKKIGIVATFIVGLFVTVCSIIRMKFLVNWAFDPNPTMNYANLAVWSVIELDVSVICACMPGMAGLLRRLKQRGSEYCKSKSGNHNSQGMDASRDHSQAITKTTIISVERTRGGDDGASESQMELMDRPQPDHAIYDYESWERSQPSLRS